MRSDGRLGRLQAIRRMERLGWIVDLRKRFSTLLQHPLIKRVGCDSATAEPNQQLTMPVRDICCAGSVSLSFRIAIRRPVNVFLVNCSGGQVLEKQQSHWRTHPIACDPSVRFSKFVGDSRFGYRNYPLIQEWKQSVALPSFGASCFADGMCNSRSGGLELIRIAQAGVLL